MVHYFRWYFIMFFVLGLVYVSHDRTNYRVPHKELLTSWITPSIAEAKTNIFDVDKHPILYNRKDVACLAKNIYFEAGTESMLGKMAVAQVTINRVKNGYWGDTICDVVNAKKVLVKMIIKGRNFIVISCQIELLWLNNSPKRIYKCLFRSYEEVIISPLVWYLA